MAGRFISMAMGHVVWDWNGTLLDDFDVMVEATSSSCIDLLGRPIGRDEYRDHFARPVQLLYEGIFGRPIGAEEWELINGRFHISYGQLVSRAALAADAFLALSKVQEEGYTQSLLSMWLHSDLKEALAGLGLGPQFVRVEGLSAVSDGGSKAQHLTAHLARLSEDLHAPVSPQSVVVIGDSIDDAVAAERVGACCVLVEGGSHHRADLVAAGVPVVGCLVDAVDVGLALCHGQNSGSPSTSDHAGRGL